MKLPTLAFLIRNFPASAEKPSCNGLVLNSLKLLTEARIFLLLLPFILRHRITPMNIMVTLMILAPPATYAIGYFSTTQYIECKKGYAIEVHPGHYVPCSRIDQYWDAEWEGTRATNLEMQDPNKVGPQMRRIEGI